MTTSQSNEGKPEAQDQGGKGERRVDLPSGSTATVHQAYGRHLKQAGRMAGGEVAQNPMMLTFALIAATVTIDGTAVTMEDVDEMPIDDVLALQREVMGGNASLPGVT